MSMSMSCQYSQFGRMPNGPPSPPDSKMKMNSVKYFGSSQHNLSGLPPQPHRQKGRPRKRKPKDIEAMTANLGKFFNFIFISVLLRILKGWLAFKNRKLSRINYNLLKHH